MIAQDTADRGNKYSIKRGEKLCERCRCKFECRADDILNCDCSQIKISGKVIELVRKKYKGCLCVNCLKELNQNPSLTP